MMIAFHSVFPELAQKEVRCVHVGASVDPGADEKLPSDEYCYTEFYCPNPKCDCRRVLLQVIARNQPGKIFATINYGWEKERFYRQLMPWDLNGAREVTRGELEPFIEQSVSAEAFLDLFRRVVLDEPYRLRLRRHYRILREEAARRMKQRGVDDERV